MPADDIACSLFEVIAPEFRQQVRENCHRCQTGQGSCLIQFMQSVVVDERPDEPLEP